MDANTKEICRGQLEALVAVLSDTNEEETDRMILETAASLISLVSKNSSAESMTKSELTQKVDEFQTIYCVLDSFMNRAAKAVPINEELTRLTDGKNIYEQRVQEYEEVKEKCNEKKKEISVKEVEIQTLRNTEGILFERFEELTNNLERLKKLRAEFDPQKLDTLSEEVEHLKEETEALKERESVMNETLEEWLGELSKTLKVIGNNTTAFSEEVENAKKDAEEFRTAIGVFTKTSQSYKSWFNVVKTPWKQFEESVGTEEYKKLKGVADEATLKKKNEIFARVENDLKELEKLVAACTLASQSDYTKIIKDTKE